MEILNYKGKQSGAFNGENHAPVPASLLQYIFHYLYGANEQTILKLGNVVMDLYDEADSGKKKDLYASIIKKLTDTSENGNSILPHGLILSIEAAKNVLDFVYYVEGYRGARLAVGPCICQLAAKKYPNGATEPEIKDITLYYGADIYSDLPLGHKEITAEEAKAIIDAMHEKGYVHNVMYMFGNKKGTFVMCNCENKICDVVKTVKFFGAGLTAEKGPEICKRDETKCLGKSECGKCLERCPFDANVSLGEKIIYDRDKCMGCELCVTTCKGNARTLEIREDYKFDHIMSKHLLLAGKYGYDKLEPYARSEKRNG